MLINAHPANRRRMVNELSAMLDIPAEYLHSPTYAYRIGHLVINRDGTITVDEPCMIARIRPLLLERGYIRRKPYRGPHRMSSTCCTDWVAHFR